MGKLHLQLTGFPEVVKPVPTPFVLDRVRPKQYRRKCPIVPILQVSHQHLHFRYSASFIFAVYSGVQGGTRLSVHEDSRGFRTAPCSYVCGCTWPTGQGIVAAGNAAYHEESVRFPITPNYRLLVGVVPSIVVLRPEVYSDRVVTHGKQCDSALFSPSLVCKDYC